MAGDWIKMEVALPEKPEVWQIAGLVGIDPDAVVGKLLKVWRWFDAHTESGNAVGVTYALVDAITSVTGFGEAMALCGWLEQDGAILRLPNFDRHNGKTAKNRALTAKRVSRRREKSNAGSVTPPLRNALPREEKRREEKKEKIDAADAALFAGVPDQLVRDFLAIRRAKRLPLTATAEEGLRREAAKAGLTVEAMLRLCCERGWGGFEAKWLERDRTAAVVPITQPGGGRRAL